MPSKPLQPNTDFRVSVPVQVRMSDLDPFVHVNNGVQCHYFDLGRSFYLEKVLQNQVDWTTIDLVLQHFFQIKTPSEVKVMALVAVVDVDEGV